MEKQKKTADSGIAYQNKDVAAKSFGERLKGNDLGVYGLKQIKVEDVLPTNLPAIMANELRLDNLFKLQSGEYAIVDYESRYLEENKIKYMNYVARVSERLYNEFKKIKPIKIIIIYTADVEKGTTEPLVNMGDVTMFITEAFLVGTDSKEMLANLKKKIRNREPFNDEDLLRLAIYPLTFKGDEEKQKAVSEAIRIAEQIDSEKVLKDALKGILVFSDKIISRKDAQRARRRIMLTKVEQIIEDEKNDAVNKAVNKQKREARNDKKNIARNFLAAGNSIETVIQCTGLPKRTVMSIASKL